MRQSQLHDISARVARGALFFTAVSVLSLHALAQSNDALKPLPSPILGVTVAAPAAGPVAPIAPADKANTSTAVILPNATVPATAPPSDDRVAQAAAAPPVVPAAPSTNRVSGFAGPADTVETSVRALDRAASKPAAPVVAQAPKMPGATSRANIPRLNRAPDDNRHVQHPVAAAYPGYDVIVCVAGCGPEPKAVSVYKPKLARYDVGDMLPAMDGPMRSGVIQVGMWTSETPECVAGCYDNTAIRSRIIEPVNAAAAVPSAGSPVGATDRSVMVRTSAAVTAGTAPIKPKPKAAKKSGSEWFTRRFERKASQTN